MSDTLRNQFDNLDRATLEAVTTQATSTALATSSRDAVHAGSAPRRDLSLVDFTLLVIGADIYVVAAIGAALLGPAQLVAWLVAGVLAAIIGLAFVQCAAIYPEVGGSYAYARRAFGSLVGFVAGWALYVGEWIALPVFPVAFANYLNFFFQRVARSQVVEDPGQLRDVRRGRRWRCPQTGGSSQLREARRAAGRGSDRLWTRARSPAGAACAAETSDRPCPETLIVHTSSERPRAPLRKLTARCIKNGPFRADVASTRSSRLP